GFEDNYFYADGKYYDTSKVIESLSADADVNDCAGVNEDIYIVSGNGKDAQYFLDRIHELGIPVNCNLIDRIPRENGTVIKDELEKILKNSNVSKAVSINEELYNGICEVWKSVLNTESVEPYEDFFESGGNSILVSKLMFEMLKKFSITIPFHYILENSNVMGLYNFIVNNGKVSEEQEQAKLEKLRKEMESCLDLDFSVKERIAQCSGKGDTKNLLLTGATGFLGIFILKFCKYDFEFRVNEVAFLKDGGVKDTIDKVLEIWKDTLKINDIDINANIFDIGGNSITIYLLADKMTKELGETINAVDIMTYPNVKEFASFLYLRRSGSSKEEVNAEGSERAEKIKNARRRSKTGRRA
ncbi:MAG: hypothetical protein GXY08_00860, partial [Ruminococcus sp.]|nr:hypothetical protein [Ruminococcus sp.]